MKKHFKLYTILAMLMIVLCASVSVSAASKPGTTKLTVKKASATKLKFSWKKASGAQGYIIYRATSKNGAYKAFKTVKKGSTLSYTAKYMDSGITYYYKIRAYKVVKGKKVYGGTSAAVKKNLPINIVGSWYAGKDTMFPVTFKKNGKFSGYSYRVPEGGTYKLAGNVLTLKFSYGEVSKIRITRKGSAYYMKNISGYNYLTGDSNGQVILRRK